jgi:hypothetical protein
MVRGFGAVLLVAGATSCAMPKSGSRATDWRRDNLAAQVQFDHGCPAEKIRWIRNDDWRALDLDVCGVVRRYKTFVSADGSNVPTLVDVTALYPASALPAPLPPDTSAPAPRSR